MPRTVRGDIQEFIIAVSIRVRNGRLWVSFVPGPGYGVGAELFINWIIRPSQINYFSGVVPFASIIEDVDGTAEEVACRINEALPEIERLLLIEESERGGELKDQPACQTFHFKKKLTGP